MRYTIKATTGSAGTIEIKCWYCGASIVWNGAAACEWKADTSLPAFEGYICQVCDKEQEVRVAGHYDTNGNKVA